MRSNRRRGSWGLGDAPEQRLEALAVEPARREPRQRNLLRAVLRLVLVQVQDREPRDASGSGGRDAGMVELELDVEGVLWRVYRSSSMVDQLLTYIQL